jgi:hypothetical protein
MAHDSVQALLDAWEADSDDEGRGRGGSKRKRDGDTTTWIHEDQDVPLDFMSADAAHSVLTTRQQRKRQRGDLIGSAGAENKADALRRSGLEFSADGRLVVAEVDEEKENERETEKKFTIGTDTKPKALNQLAEIRKRRAEAKAKAKAERRGAHLVKGLDSYKPGKKKAFGDAKRKGSKLDPYAYIRLNPKVTKERFKKKAADTFRKVVQGSKKGIIKGKKAKALDKRVKGRDGKKKFRFSKKPGKPGSR